MADSQPQPASVSTADPTQASAGRADISSKSAFSLQDPAVTPVTPSTSPEAGTGQED